MIHRLYVSLFDVSLCRLSVMLSQLDKMSGLIITRLHPVGWACSRVPCGNRFSTSQVTVPPITDTLMYLGALLSL